VSDTDKPSPTGTARRLGMSLARLIAKAENPPHLGIQAPTLLTVQLGKRLARYRLAWYSARKGRMVLRANIAEALLAHVDKHIGGPVYDGKTLKIKTEPAWCDCCGVPYPCTTRRLLTRPPMDADQ
jgi:hypothetical protein